MILTHISQFSGNLMKVNTLPVKLDVPRFLNAGKGAEFYARKVVLIIIRF
jgi:hypothetical protein